MTPRFTALCGANVLSPSLLRNLLMYLVVSGLVAARWREAIPSVSESSSEPS